MIGGRGIKQRKSRQAPKMNKSAKKGNNKQVSKNRDPVLGDCRLLQGYNFQAKRAGKRGRGL